MISGPRWTGRSEEHTSELQSRLHLVCRLLLEKKKKLCREHPAQYLSHHSVPPWAGLSVVMAQIYHAQRQHISTECHRQPDVATRSSRAACCDVQTSVVFAVTNESVAPTQNPDLQVRNLVVSRPAD